MGKLKQLVLTLGLSLTLVGCGVVTESTVVEGIKDLTQEESSIQSEDRNTEESTKESTSGLVIDEGYTYLETDGGDTSGHREPLTKTNIGFGDREYFAYTNEYGQLVRVTAKEIILQDDDNEPVKSNGRYYNNMANVPGTEQSNLDKGHIIADSLGGVSNAYNITPQDSTLNRHGDQAYMERVIRDAGGATDFTAIITYPNTTTQIPSHYEYTYTVKGNTVTDSFDNLNPDELNEALGLTTPQEESKQEESKQEESKQEESKQEESKQEESTNTTATTSGEYVDENGNGLIKGSSSGIYHTPGSSYYDKTTNPKALFKTVQEAEDAGYRAPKR